jgi:hypothetical protein
MSLASDAPFPALPDVSAADLAQVQRGEIVARIETTHGAGGKAAGRGFGAIALARPVAEVYATLARCDDRAEYMPRLKRIDILEQSPTRVRLKQSIDASIKTAYSTLLLTLEPDALRISWALDKTARDNSVIEVEGDYRMVALAEQRTLLVYRAYIDSGLKVPALITNHLQKRAVPELLTAIKQRIESGGRYRK